MASEVQELTGTVDVAVIAQGEHLCMAMRGIRTPHRMTSSVLAGVFRHEAPRAEFLCLVDLTRETKLM
jgi:GTP cyclohydrolase I